MRFVLLALLAVPALASAQRFYRIPVRHADPYAIKAMMEGRPLTSPEISTIAALTGQTGMGAAVTAANLAQGGTFFVDPTDNSLCWVPGK